MERQRHLRPLFLLAALLIGALALLEARQHEKIGSSALFDMPILLGTAAAAVGSLILRAVNKLLGRGEAVPNWFVAIHVLRSASLPAVLVLAALGLAMWLAGSTMVTAFFGAVLLIIAAFAMLGIWSLLALQLLRLVRR